MDLGVLAQVERPHRLRLPAKSQGLPHTSDEQASLVWTVIAPFAQYKASGGLGLARDYRQEDWMSVDLQLQHFDTIEFEGSFSQWRVSDNPSEPWAKDMQEWNTKFRELVLGKLRESLEETK